MDKKILLVEKKQVDRVPLGKVETLLDFDLSPAQETALAGIRAGFQDKQVTLLHGVTSSGKTQIYVKLIEDALANGKQVLYLLPEIALTAQIIRRLQKHFAGQIGIYHSRFSNNERVEIWNKVKSGEIRIVLGARSSLLLPFRDLGLIILDEEHDASFKQHEPAPRYHARDAAIYYASLFKAKVLLGSATPALESYYNAKQGKYALVELNERFGGIDMPDIEIVDLKKENALKEVVNNFTSVLRKEITQSLENKKQVILFQNRRGMHRSSSAPPAAGSPTVNNATYPSLTINTRINSAATIAAPVILTYMCAAPAAVRPCRPRISVQKRSRKTCWNSFPKHASPAWTSTPSAVRTAITR